MNIIIEQPKEAVIDLQILKYHLRIDHEHEDLYLKEIIGMATEILENNIGKPILRKKYKYIFYGEERRPRKIMIPTECVDTIISVKNIIDKKNKSDARFFIETEGGKTYVITGYFKYPIEIIYLAGMTGRPSKIPRDLKYAVLQMSKSIYDCSEENILESECTKRIINGYRTISIN
jgi:uncharacterized phiE125 gp8 family phage protein